MSDICIDYLNLYGNIGGQAKSLLEQTFDRVANSNIVCVKTDGSTLKFKAILHDEVVRARRQRLTVENEEGIIDMQSKRVILLNRDIINYGLQTLDAAWYLLIDNRAKTELERFDFSITEPFSDTDTTPYFGANQVFSVYYVRRAEELDSQVASVPNGTGQFSFNSLVAE